MPYNITDYEKRVFLTMNYISKNIERDLPLEEVAKVASFSMYHFHRIFKAVVGETVAAFTRRLRIELAANHLISRPQDNITTIAVDCGFSSSQNFAKAFRKQIGITPSEYRDSKIGNIDSKNGNVISDQSLYNLDEFMSSINNLRENTVNTEIRQLPEYNAAYIRKIGPYNDQTCQPAFQELMQWAISRNYVGPGKILSIYWDNPDVTPPERCRFDACIIVPEDAVLKDKIYIQKIAGGPYVVCHFETRPEYIQQAWEDSYLWLIGSGLECDDTPCFELYHNNAVEHPEGKWIYDICIPLKK